MANHDTLLAAADLTARMRTTIHRISDDEGPDTALRVAMALLSSLSGLASGTLVLSEGGDLPVDFEQMKRKNLEVVERLRAIIEGLTVEQYTLAKRIVGYVGPSAPSAAAH